MKNRFRKSLMLGALLLAGSHAALRPQSFSVPWFVVAGGGGAATNGNMSLTGTFGQWDASEQPATNGTFAVTSGYWNFLPEAAPAAPAVFSDHFTSNSIPSLWNFVGNTIVETNGMMLVSNGVANDGGMLSGVPFAVNPTGLITIARTVTIHAAASALADYPGTNFLGQFGITIGALAPFSVNYADWDYADGVTYTNRLGFFLARDGALPIFITDQANVSSEIAPIWDASFNEMITYEPTNGVMQYFINNVFQASFNVGALPATTSATMMLTFNAFGLGTGDSQTMEDLVVTQLPGVSNGTAVLVLSGNLAFGGLPMNTSSNGMLTISNAGNSSLAVSNITYPTGFGGSNLSVTIAAGGSTNVTVTFSPTAATNNYGGAITVVSDASSGADTIPVSGFVASGTLTLVVDLNGNGAVSPKDNGKLLTAGAKVTLKATAGTGAVFSGWTGSIVTSQNPLTFIMSNSVLLQANFTNTPFTAANIGTYDGLFSTSNGVAEGTAGMLKGLTVNTKGGYSGALLINGTSKSISGGFSASGNSSNYIARTASLGGPLVVEMTLAFNESPPLITGTVSNAAWVADLVAYRALSTGSAQYTMLLAPTVLGLPGVPSGYGYVLLSEKAGVLTLIGALADGTTLSQTVPMTQAGEVPVYDSLYGNTGLLTGWVNFTSGAPSGNLDWIRPKGTHPLLYPNGFTNAVLAQGAVWSPAAGIGLSAGQINVSGGTLSSSLSFGVAFNAKNALMKTSNNPTNSLTGSINPKTGLLTITFGNGNGKSTTAGFGAVLQDAATAAGFFLDKTNAGTVVLTP